MQDEAAATVADWSSPTPHPAALASPPAGRSDGRRAQGRSLPTSLDVEQGRPTTSAGASARIPGPR